MGIIRAFDFKDISIFQIPDAAPTTVRAVVSTVNSGASKPHLVITETLSTIDIEVTWPSPSSPSSFTSPSSPS